MDKNAYLGNLIKKKRLSLNLTMEQIARKVGTNRSTLWSIEKGNLNCSMKTFLAIIDFLNLSFNVEDKNKLKIERVRASRVNKTKDKKINSFIIMCVEQYAKDNNEDSKINYEKMIKKGIIEELEKDYPDLHGMSTSYLNNFIESLMEGN